MKVECAYKEMWPIEKVVPNPKNYNRHPDKQIQMLAKIIQETGWRAPIVVSLRSGLVVKGHARLAAAKLAGFAEVPVDLQAYASAAQEIADLIADNKIAELAESDDDLLSGLLMEIGGDYDMDMTGIPADDLPDLGNSDGLTEPDDVPETPAEPATKRGQLFRMGNHRLMCGDSTSAADVARLMGGGVADMVLTDPPYGVAYVGKTKDALTIESDDCSEEKLIEFCTAWFNNAQSVSRLGAYWVATVPPGPLHEVFLSDWKRRGILRQVMVWVKDSMVLGHSEYHYKHEPILFGWVPGGERLKNTDRTKTTVWEFDRPKRSAEHPTMKPVNMWCYAIEQHTVRDNVLFEPFSGSGTTHIACEQTGRRCYGMELAPQYCDVIIKRWENFTGKKAELIEE